MQRHARSVKLTNVERQTSGRLLVAVWLGCAEWLEKSRRRWPLSNQSTIFGEIEKLRARNGS